MFLDSTEPCARLPDQIAAGISRADPLERWVPSDLSDRSPRAVEKRYLKVAAAEAYAVERHNLAIRAPDAIEAAYQKILDTHPRECGGRKGGPDE